LGAIINSKPKPQAPFSKPAAPLDAVMGKGIPAPIKPEVFKPIAKPFVKE
jgi:hypothetical protein